MTPLDKTLKREVRIKGRAFVVALSPEGLKITLKGKRRGQELRWADLISGDAALAVALNASLGEFARSAAPKVPAAPEADAAPKKRASLEPLAAPKRRASPQPLAEPKRNPAPKKPPAPKRMSRVASKLKRLH